MKQVQNIKKVSLIFFIITGFLHLGSTAFILNNLYLKQALILNKIMDVPFVITGLAYGLSSLRIALTRPDKDHKVLDIILIGVIILALIAMIAINLIFPDLQQ